MNAIYDTAEIAAALRAADIDYRVEAPGTTVESIHVTRSDGRTVAFGPSTTETGQDADGIDVAYYRGGIDSDIVTSDWVPTTGQLVANLRDFLGF